MTKALEGRVPIHRGPEMNSAWRRRLTLVAMCIAQGMIWLDVTIVNVALPSIQRELHESSGELEWVISAYALSLAALIPLSGSLGDRFGRKRFFAAGMVVFALGSMACALSSSAVELSAARAFQGVGGAMMSALALSILSQAYSGKARADAIGIWATCAGLGPVVGGLLLGVFRGGDGGRDRDRRVRPAGPAYHRPPPGPPARCRRPRCPHDRRGAVPRWPPGRFNRSRGLEHLESGQLFSRLSSSSIMLLSTVNI